MNQTLNYSCRGFRQILKLSCEPRLFYERGDFVDNFLNYSFFNVIIVNDRKKVCVYNNIALTGREA